MILDHHAAIEEKATTQPTSQDLKGLHARRVLIFSRISQNHFFGFAHLGSNSLRISRFENLQFVVW